MQPGRSRNLIITAWKNTTARLHAVWEFTSRTGLGFTVVLLTATLLIFFAWSFFIPDTWKDYRVEFAGLIFDIVFILLILAEYEHLQQNKQDIKRQEETIEDYKRWDSEEARFRLAGAIRRLNRLGIEKLNLTGLQLSDFKFAKHGIGGLKGSVFYDGSWGEPLKPAEVHLQRVEFNWVDCRDVQFSPFNPLQGLVSGSSNFAIYSDCSFIHSDLRDASFVGATLIWTSNPPKSLFNDFIVEEDGQHTPIPTGYGPFDSANLAATSFENAYFHNADFRGAENIVSANFKGVTGLETCIFDDDALENESLRVAKVKTTSRV